MRRSSALCALLVVLIPSLGVGPRGSVTESDTVLLRFGAISIGASDGTCLRTDSTSGAPQTCTGVTLDRASHVVPTGGAGVALACILADDVAGIDGSDTVVLEVIWQKPGESLVASTNKVTFDAADSDGSIKSVVIGQLPYAAPLTIGVRLQIDADGGTAISGAAIVCSLRTS